MPGRNIDNEVPNATFGDRLQMFTDGSKVHPLNPGGAWLENMPRLYGEFMQTPPSHLGFQVLEVRKRPRGVHGVDGAVHR